MRKLHPDGPLSTFWDYKFERWPKDKGMRLDHFLLSRNLSVRLVDGGVDLWARGQENASDHAPTWIMLDLYTRVEIPATRVAPAHNLIPDRATDPPDTAALFVGFFEVSRRDDHDAVRIAFRAVSISTTYLM
jgi:hypothetical protein